MTVFKILFGEVYRQIYSDGRAYSQNMISDRISDDISPQMNIHNMFIHILVHICSLVSTLELGNFKLHKIACHPMECDVINDVKLYATVSKDILPQIFDVIQSDVVLQKQVH